MSAADDAYAKAAKMIAEAKANEWDTLDFGTPQTHALQRLPPEISDLDKLTYLDLNSTQVTDIAPLAGLSALQRLDLSDTQVTDIAPLAGLSTLQELGLSGTQVTDIAPLAGLSALQTLDLIGTQVTDIAPLAGLSALRTLHLSSTQVTDIAPLAGLSALRTLYLDNVHVRHINALADAPALRTLSLTGTRLEDLRPILTMPQMSEEGASLWFEETPFSKATPELETLAELGASDNTEQCARDTIAYLKTLPKWPDEPLPWAVPDQTDAPALPGGRPAPVMVRLSRDGRLVAAPPEINLEDDARKRAEQAWQALCNYLEDLTALRGRTTNAMPALARAFDSFERALGGDFESLNQIDLGMQADRLRRLAGDAEVYLMDQDPEELSAFVAALALYLRRFNTWNDYQDDAPLPREDQDHIREDREDFEALNTSLTATEQVEDRVEAGLRDVIDAGTDESATPLDQKGLVDSLSNTFEGVAEESLDERKTLGNKTQEYFEELEAEAGAKSRDEIYKIPGAAPAIWATLFLFNNRDKLTYLATRYPDSFGFLTSVLRFLFP